MQVRLWIAAMLAAGLAACGAPEPAKAPADAPAVTAEPAVAPAPAEASPRYVGLWAVSERLCAEPAWHFRPEEVSTLGEVHCAFTDVKPNGASYAIEAMCTAEAPPAPYQLELSLTDAPRTMTVSGGPWMAPTQLVYCAPLPVE